MRRRSSRSLRQKVLLSIGVVLTLFSLAGAASVGYAYARFNSITRYDVDLPPAAEGEPRNFLVVGSDSRDGLDPSDPDYGGFVDDGVGEGAGQRTDTIMILRVDPDTEQVDLLSLPRDLYLPIGGPDGELNRINVAFAEGRQTLIDTIQRDLGIPIHHYVEVDFAGFKDLVDAIGGVDVYFDTAVRDPNTGLAVTDAGCVTLGPVEALQFVRSRHLEIRDDDGDWVSDPTGDIGRIARQQLFIREAISRAISKGLTNPVRLNELVGVGVDNVGLDPGFGANDLLSFGRRFASFDPSSLNTHTPVVTPFTTGGGASVLDLDEEASEGVFNIFRGLPSGSVSPRFIDLTVLNAGSVDGEATDVAAALGQIGFAIDVIGDTDEPDPRTAIHFAPGSEPAALQVAAHLTSPPELVADPDLDANEIVLVVGPDFTTVHELASTEDLTGLLPASTTSTTVAGEPTSSTSTTSTTLVNGYVPDADGGLSCG